MDASPVQAFAFLWRRRWSIGACTALAAAAGLFYAQHRGTIWRARSVLYVERDSPVMPGSDVSLWLRSRNYANTQAALLRSTPILQSGLAQPGIDKSPVFGDSTNHLAWLKRNLTVAVGEQDDLISLGVDSPLVQDACEVVNAVVNAYLTFHQKSQRDTAVGILQNLTSELARYEGELRTVQGEQVEFLARHPGVGPTNDAATVAAERLRELNGAVTRAEIETLEAEAAWRAAKSLAGAADLVRQLPVQGAGLLPTRQELDEVQQLRALQQRRQQLLAEVTPEHPEVKRLSALIAEYEQRTAASDERLAKAYVDILEQRYLSMKQKLDELTAKVAEQERRIQAVDPAQAEYHAIEVRVERARKIADALYERVRTIDINKSLDAADNTGLNTLVYEYATPGGAVVASSKRAIVVIATFLGLILGIGLAWFRSLIDQRLRTPDEVTGLLPLLATVPKIAPDRRGVVQTWQRVPEFGEAMRSLRTIIYFGFRSERSRILQITSAHERDGKSLITAGLAIAMAQVGHRVLVVDADFQQAAQAGLFELTSETGLLQVLAKRVTPAAVIVKTRVPNLHLLATGSPVRSTGELLDGSRLAAVLQELAKEYDRVLIDSPPLPIVDARIIAAVCDESLLVLRSGRTTKKLVESAVGLVASVGGRVSGAVLNWSPRAGLGTGGSRYTALAIDPLAKAGEVAPADVGAVKETRTPG